MFVDFREGKFEIVVNLAAQAGRYFRLRLVRKRTRILHIFVDELYSGGLNCTFQLPARLVRHPCVNRRGLGDGVALIVGAYATAPRDRRRSRQ